MTVDLSTVPLVALSIESKQLVSTLLNPIKVIPSENGLPRDWRGLAHLSNLSGEAMPLVISHADPFAYILSAWTQKQKNVTIKDFQRILEEIDRWDILDDTLELFERDAVKYLEQVKKSQTSAEIVKNEIDKEILTIDDLHRLREGLEGQYYDAFLLFADEDVKFATEMVDRLEDQYNLKLCLKDRDLIGGVTFEHEAVMTLISERCNRLIVIVTSNFLKSALNKFFLNYAQALGIEKQQRKIIPCLYEKCPLPPILHYMFKLDYNRAGFYDFWGKLRDSVQIANNTKTETKSVISEIRPASLSNHLHVKIVDTMKKEEDKEYLNTSKVQNFQSQNNVEMLKTPESLRSPELIGVHNTKNNTKKYNNFLQWTKKRWNKKSESDKKEYAPITETVSLPSLENLDTLNTSTETVERKRKEKFINKYVKRVLVKS